MIYDDDLHNKLVSKYYLNIYKGVLGNIIRYSFRNHFLITFIN